ncbi:peptide deformylase [Streptomyces griseus]|uniref:peptide deformylase n=1 Tax=Streptomyces griseus TaxID=1911 RepID=UPI000849A726|nr:peptide deformylase [Streptomyces griseus]SEE25393.1 peptide deformylase [Streptomyces griseus]SQA27330.1 XRE family transcriptional regulator [Streptomyces griseus]
MTGQGEPSFAAELKHFREVRGLAKAELARRLKISPSYVSHLESGRERGSSDLARRLETELDAGGKLWKAWKDDDSGPQLVPESADVPPSAGILVLEDSAALRYDGTHYHLTMHRRLRNTGTEPITRYLVRIAVDRYPGEPERSNALYRAHPLTWEELQVEAHCGDEQMGRVIKHDRDAFKEIWLEFANSRTRFPLYPGQEAGITYSYSVTADKWGPWFQRAVRLPTRELTVSLSFPTDLQPTVWGTETSLSANAAPLRTPPAHAVDADHTVYTWTTLDPPLHARYRMEWRLKTEDPAESEPVNTPAPSALMATAGIIQEGDIILQSVAQPFDLPSEADDARRVVSELSDAITRVRTLHDFGKGMGIAAPQIGISRAAAIVVPPGDGASPIVLLNPTAVESSAETDRQYEGCLSFFDVRGLVPRPLHIVINHTDIEGTPHLTRFEHGLARLVLHEVDHLDGRLYRTRMEPGTEPIPVEEYRGTGRPWNYR